MSEIIRNADRNKAIQAMMTDGEKLKSFYRFVVNNPHIPLHDACQIVIARPNASICFSFEEWNALGRRVTKGRKGIPYYDSDGNKYFVFDVTDTHGENRYRRATQPVKKILDGLDLLNGTEIADSNRGDYRIMLSGVVTYLGQNDFLTENDEIRNRLIAEGVAYSLYSSTGFPKERGITLKGYPYGLNGNTDLFREIQKVTAELQQDINDAVFNKKNEVPVIDDTEEDYVTDEPVLPKAYEQSEPEAGDDEPTDEEIEEAFAAAEAEETDSEGDYDSEDYDYEESRKPTKAEKPENKGKRMFERRNRPSMQKSLFDAFETKTPEQELTEQILKGGSGMSGGKIRIYTEYLKNPYEKDFVRFLSKEYGIGGRGGPDGIDEMHDGKGIRFSKKNTETGEIEVAVNLKWEQAAVKIADLIDEENYLNDEEQKEYDTLVRFREERSAAKSDDDLIKIVARQIVEYGTAHTYGEKYSEYPHFLGESIQFYTQHYEEVNAELIKFDEVKSVGKGNIYPYSSTNLSFRLPYCPLWQAKEARLRECDERIKEYVDKFTRKCADEYRQTYDKNVVLTVTPEDISSREYLFLKDNREDFIKYFLKQKGVQDVNLSINSHEEVSALKGTEFKQGDVVTTTIKCKNGELITLKLDTTLPRLYDREITVSGTKGYYSQTLKAVILDGEKFNHEKDSIQSALNSQNDYEEYLPDDWKTITEEQLKSGHGGMDYIMLKHFFRAVKNGEDMPIDVYEACAMMCVTALSEQSIANGGAPVEVPDFTNGKYKNRAIVDVLPLPVIDK